jgi:uncharacterized protein
MEIYALIFALSIIQSLFGVGILLFGTPLLLLSGLNYTEALLYLLPASASLSWSQVWDHRKQKLDRNYRQLFFLVCLPALILGMLLNSRFHLSSEIKFFVLGMLILTFVLRTSQSFSIKLEEFVGQNLPWGIGLMGLIHGLSNMGGSFLTPIVSSLYRDKNKVLAGVSFDYAFMASCQLVFLLGIQNIPFEWKYLVGAMISILVRNTIGKRVLSFTSELHYQRLLNGFILANALVLGIKLI